jgi:hypothetical protein
MKLTRKKAKELSIAKWQLIYDNNWTLKQSEKELRKNKIWEKIADFSANCALCELYVDSFVDCELCPISEENINCFNGDSYFAKWAFSGLSPKKRKEYAGKILQIIKDWKV